MKPSTVSDLINKQDWLEPVDNTLSALADSTLKPAGQSVQNFLHGTWLGHPLHPVLTDIPVGAWSVSAVLDLVETLGDTGEYSRAADAALSVGLVAAVGTAVSGLCDWQHTDRPARRVGALHAMFNIGATACYVTSWMQRRQGNRDAGITTGFVGYLLVLAGAYLGGHLSYEQRIGVDHTQRGDGPDEWTKVIAEQDLPEAQLRCVNANGVDILLVKRGARIFAIGEKCAHLRGPLSEGRIEDGNSVRCPWHGSRFSLEDGSVIDGPATFDQPCFETRIRDGQIEVRARGA